MQYLYRVLEAVTKIPREKSVFDQRLDFDNLMARHKNRREFKRHLRMTPKSFYKLLGYIKPKLERNQKMGSLRGGYIIEEICLYATLRWLAGGSYSDIYMCCDVAVG